MVHKHQQGPKGWSTMLDGGSTSTSELPSWLTKIRLVLRSVFPSRGAHRVSYPRSVA
jgi:hypothetical protein